MRTLEQGSRARLFLILPLALGVVLVLAIVLAKRCSAPSTSILPPASSSVTLVRPTANVLVAVRGLARLESTAFHMERVIDLTEKQSRLFGLMEGEDAILLVAVANISAGVDLAKLTPADVESDPAKGRVHVRLPPPEVFHSALDSKRTYVHTRRTSTLARRQEQLETRARQEAERVLVEGAIEAGLLTHASENASRVVEGLLRSLGYSAIEVTTRAPPQD